MPTRLSLGSCGIAVAVYASYLLKTRSRSDFAAILLSKAWYFIEVSGKACIHFTASGFQIEYEMFI